MNELDELLNVLEIDSVKRRNLHQTNVFITMLRRIRYGWLGALLIFLVSIALAWLLHFPLSKVQKSITKMDVMFIKEREGNQNNNVSSEIIGQITGWRTTTNKYDEIAIMMSKPVIERMLRKTQLYDNVIRQKRLDSGISLTKKDSTKEMRNLIDGYLDKTDVTYDEPVNGKRNSIFELSMQGDYEENKNALKGIVDAYNSLTREYNDVSYVKTIKFLTHCIDSIDGELRKIDAYDESFSEGNFIIDVEKQTNTYLDVNKGDESDVRNMQLQRELLKIIRKYMADMGHNYVVVPANTGIDDAQINRIVIQFNDLVMRRSNFLTSMGEDAMRVQTITNQIEDQRQAIIVSIDKLTQAFDIRLKKYEDNKKVSEGRLAGMPRKKIIKDQIRRERDIIMPLYTMLQRKRIETIIARSAEQDLARIITPPYQVEQKLFKTPKIIYLTGVLLGLILAIVYLYLIKIPNEKVTIDDIIKSCDLPLWGLLPNGEKHNSYYKAMESLLTRIKMSGAKQILITSGYEKEGKTFLKNSLMQILEDKGVKDIKVIEEGSYHENPDIPEISNYTELTIYCIRPNYSLMRSIDFANYAKDEKLLKNGVVVATCADVNDTLPINFGSFDYEAPKGLKALKMIANK